MMRRAAWIGFSLFVACAPPAPTAPPARPAHGTTAERALSYLISTLRPFPEHDKRGLLAVTDPTSGRVAVYDSALVTLVLLRRGDRERAGRILMGLAALQSGDGSLPFSFSLPAPNEYRGFVRSGAVAWVGYAAAEYLDSESGGEARESALRLAHHAAAYLVSLRVAQPGDPRDGLIRGGSGRVKYDLDDSGKFREVFEPGSITWTSIEHNVDSYFFLRTFARVTGSRAYEAAATGIAHALIERAWRDDAGQLTRGLGERGIDPMLALDCASWGSVFLAAAGDAPRAEMALQAADGPMYATRDARTGARGHRPYPYGPILDDPRLLQRFASSLPARTWDRLQSVWPEGSAGVALAALRTGHRDRAREILDALEPLRGRDGSLPTANMEVPLNFDTLPGIAGTAWVELVRFDVERAPARATLWAP